MIRRSGKRSSGIPCRPFTILDGMILVAGAAVGVAVLRGPFEDYALRDTWGFWGHPFVGGVLIILAALMLIFRLRRPRQSIRQIASQPGAVACFTMVAFSSVAMVDQWLQDAFQGGLLEIPLSSYNWSMTFLAVQQYLLAWNVVICWTLLALGRRWRPEPGWIDGTSRAIGWAWIVWGISGLILRLIELYLHSIAVPISGASPI
jgi:formate-dependent nitrite reductase membrane component NrfD